MGRAPRGHCHAGFGKGWPWSCVDRSLGSQASGRFEQGYPTVTDCYNTANSFRIRCRFASDAELNIRDNAPDLGFENGVLFECEKGRFFVNRGKLTGKPIEDLKKNPLPQDLLASLRKGRAVMTHHENFFRACKQRVSPISEAASHIRHLNVCHLSNIALRLGRDLQWDPAAGSVTGAAAAEQMLVREQRQGFEVS